MDRPRAVRVDSPPPALEFSSVHASSIDWSHPIGCLVISLGLRVCGRKQKMHSSRTAPSCSPLAGTSPSRVHALAARLAWFGSILNLSTTFSKTFRMRKTTMNHSRRKVLQVPPQKQQSS
eukprot:Rmarinus@m.25121